MNNRMNTVSVMRESNPVMASEAVVGYAMILVDMLRGLIARVGSVLNIKSKSTVVLSGLIAFFAFAMGAFALGSVAGIVFFLGIRPFVN